MFERLFLSHPRQVGETYFEHQRAALSFAVPLLGAGFAAVVHACVPCLFERTATSGIVNLHDRVQALAARRRAQAGGQSEGEPEVA